MDPRNGSTGPPPPPGDKQNKAHQRDAPTSTESWRWAAPEQKGDGRRGERVGVWVMRGATKPTTRSARQPPAPTARCRSGPRQGRVGGVGVGAAGRERAPNRLWRVCLPPGAAHPRPHAGQPTRAASWRVRGVGIAGPPLGHGQNPQPGSRFDSRPRPRPPSGGYWRRRVAVGGWPSRGTRGGARKRRARRRGARAHAAAEGDHVPPPPRAAAGGGGRPGLGLTDEVERVVGGRDRLGKLRTGRSAPVQTSLPPLSAPCVAVGGRPPPPKLGGTRCRAATEAARPTTRPRRLRARARSRAASALPAAAGAPGPGAGRASGGRAHGGRRGPVGERAAASGRARVGRRLRRAAPRPG